jgi:hypothetical protein
VERSSCVKGTRRRGEDRREGGDGGDAKSVVLRREEK